ncbi:major facilitator superfamily domain-containing protein [Aspergillus alliaceus]|uniref:major facilitator superfamily domain-containing protein n=1 Tax=Petromyces alliaceus TaxID=209559 RepID=UPI0012A69F8C|nr:major facilitator superfamily domain-containing protein [Aspergillus alliaceus]KAB8236909.1 major facilitator superfamily domain-containing protein [Aspergillus alliaceus]
MDVNQSSELTLELTFRDYSGASKKADSAEIRLVRKLDMRIMPILWVMYFTNFIDRNAMPILVGTQYNTCISISFKATVSSCTALTRNYVGLVMVRFFLEIALRISIFYSGNILATVISGLIATAIFATLDKKRGVVTFGIAVAGIFMLPDHPLATHWLTPDERLVVHNRIEKDAVRREDSFFPAVIGSLGFNRSIMSILTCPAYILSCLAGIVVRITSGRYNERTWHITLGMGIDIVRFIISCITLNAAALYLSFFLLASGPYSINSANLGWVSATMGQTPEKKAASLSFISMMANTSYIYTAYLYPKSDGPRYLTAIALNAAFCFSTVACAWVLRLWLQSANRQIRLGAVSGANERVLYAY